MEMRRKGCERPHASQAATLERLRDLTVKIYLWAQRFRWPVPTAVRNIMNGLVARSIDREIPDRTDKWPDVLNLSVLDDHRVRPAADGGETSFGTSKPPIAASRETRSPVRPNVPARLRCLVATSSLELGGLERTAALLGRGLPLHGLDTTFAHTPSTGVRERIAESLHLEDIPVIKLSQDTGRQWLETHRPDVISMHSPPDWLVADAAGLGIPMLETLQDTAAIFAAETWQRVRARSGQMAGFVAVAELIRRLYLRANPGYPQNRIVTILNCVDDQHITRRNRTQARAWLGLGSEFLFVSLARHSMQKNTFGLVAAFSDVVRAYPEAHLLVAGVIWDKSYFEQVRRLRDGLSCADHIRLCGPCPDVSAVLAAADAFVLDSFYEGSSLAAMEALVAGLPVVISDAGAAREQVGENGCRGFVVGNPLGDPEAVDWPSIARARFRPQVNRAALVEAMCKVVVERDRWRNVRDELSAESVDRFSAEVCVRRHAEVLTRAAADGRVR
jgi:glycosyltransferase involved in cell wall biosynthesis